MTARVVLSGGESTSGRELLERALVEMFVIDGPTEEPFAAIGMGSGAVEALSFAARGAAAALILIHPIAQPVEGIDVPTLILWGEDDPDHDQDEVEAIHEVIDSSSLGLLPGCGSDPVADAPQTVIPLVIEYLRSTYLHVAHGHSGAVRIQLGRGPVG